MRMRHVFAALSLSAILCFFTPAQSHADPGDHKDKREHDERGRHHDWHRDRGGHDYHHKKWHGHYYQPPRQQVYIYQSPRPTWAWDYHAHTPQAGYVTYRWRRGGYIPPQMTIVPVYEWQELYLPPPPRGAFYGYVDHDLLLLSQATYQILDVLMNRR